MIGIATLLAGSSKNGTGNFPSIWILQMINRVITDPPNLKMNELVLQGMLDG